MRNGIRRIAWAVAVLLGIAVQAFAAPMVDQFLEAESKITKLEQEIAILRSGPSLGSVLPSFPYYFVVGSDS